MQVHGRDVQFLCTVETHHKISALAEDNNIDTVLARLNGSAYVDTVELYTLAALFCVAMSEGYESNRAWEDPSYVPRPLTAEELGHLVRKDFDALYMEAVTAFTRDIGASVETEEAKGKKTEDAPGESA